MSTLFKSRNYSTREALAETQWSEKTFRKWIKLRGTKPTKKGWWAKSDIDTMLEWVREYNSTLSGAGKLTLDSVRKLSNNHHDSNILVSLTENGINNLFHLKGSFAIVPVPSGKEEEYLEKLQDLIQN